MDDTSSFQSLLFRTLSVLLYVESNSINKLRECKPETLGLFAISSHPRVLRRKSVTLEVSLVQKKSFRSKDHLLTSRY